jgi:hypothetical protein
MTDKDFKIEHGLFSDDPLTGATLIDRQVWGPGVVVRAGEVLSIGSGYAVVMTETALDDSVGMGEA